MASTDFRTNLIAVLESTPDLRRRSKKILAVLKGPKSRRRDRTVERMENHVWITLDFTLADQVYSMSSDCPFDWSTIDWPAVIEVVLRLLLALLPFLLFAERTKK